VSEDRSQMTAEQLATEKKRLWWHSRRGMLELDVLLLPFLEEAYSDLSEENQAKYRKLLDCEDPDLFKWFMQNGRPEDQDHADIVDIILKRVQPS
jgi:antitoxin CptB